MNRRQFLASLGIGAPAAIVQPRLDRGSACRTYFFAPKQGWGGDAFANNLAVEHLRKLQALLRAEEAVLCGYTSIWGGHVALPVVEHLGVERNVTFRTWPRLTL